MNKKITFFGLSLIALMGFFAGANVASAAVVTTCNSATFNGSVTPNGNPTEVWFEWGTSTSLGYATPHQTFTVNATFSQVVSALTENTTYYYRAMASNSAGTATGGTISFNTPSCVVGTPTGSLPSATTNSATSISTDRATLNAFVNPNSTSDTSYWFEWGTSTSLSNSTSHYNQGVAASNTSVNITGLTQNTTYYYRITAQNAQGVVHGSIVSFTTNYGNTNTGSSLPVVSTSGATSSATDYAVLNGYVDPSGTTDTTRWFEWGTSTNLNNSTQKLSQGSSASSISATLTGLSQNTVYYYRAVAQNSQGTVYGSILSFTSGYANTTTNNTISTAPTATTLLATEISGTNAKLNGLVFTSASQSSSAWFEWGSNTNLGYKTQTVNVGALPSIKHSEFISGLTSGQTYYYRIVAENPYGKTYGTLVSFVAERVTATPADTNVVITVPARTTTVRNTTTVINQGTGVLSLVSLSVDGGSEIIVAGEKRGYHIVWKNESTQTLKNVVLRVTLPSSMKFEGATNGSYSSVDNVVTVDIKTLASKEGGDLSVFAIAERTLSQGELVVVTANMVYTDARGVQGDAIAYAMHRGSSIQNSLGANLFSAGSFLPTSIFEWILLFILVLILVLLANHLYGRFSKEER